MITLLLLFVILFHSSSTSSPTEYLISDNLNRFGLSIFKELNRKHVNENLLFSPFSLYYVLSMLIAGTSTTTRNEILKQLLPTVSSYVGTENLDWLEFLDLSSEFFAKFAENEYLDELILFNVGFVMDEKYKMSINKRYLDILNEKYYCEKVNGLSFVDFSSGNVKNRINEMVNDGTKHLIEEFYPRLTYLDHDYQFLLLSNLVFVHLNFADEPFKKARMKGFKTLSKTGENKVINDFLSIEKMYKNREKNFRFGNHIWNDEGKSISFESIGLDLKEGFELLILKPEPESLTNSFDLNNFIENLNKYSKKIGRNIYSAIHHEQEEGVEEGRMKLLMPKFEIDSKMLSFTDIFEENLGIKEIFRKTNKDFSNFFCERSQGTEEEPCMKIDQDLLRVGDVLQRVSFRLDENGVYSVYKFDDSKERIMGEKSNKATKHIQLNHPFVFFLAHKHTGTILMMGKLMKPYIDTSGGKTQLLSRILKSGKYDYIHDEIPQYGTGVFVKQMMVILVGLTLMGCVLLCAIGSIYLITQPDYVGYFKKKFNRVTESYRTVEVENAVEEKND